MSDVTAHAIDEEIRAFIDTAYQQAEDILRTHMDKLHTMSDALIRYETIDENQIRDIMAGREPSPPEDWDDGDPTATAGSDRPRDLDKDADSPIGGPASQH